MARQNRNTADRHHDSYDALSLSFHWAICALVVVLCALGFLFYKLEFNTPDYNFYYYWHRSLGELTFALVLASIVWRAKRNPPSPFADVHWRSVTASLVKGAIIVLLVVVPLTKIWRGAYGIGWVFFSMQIPAPLPPNKAMGNFLTDTHFYTAIALIVLSGVHSAAAIWHHFLLKDGVLARMMPAKRI